MRERRNEQKVSSEARKIFREDLFTRDWKLMRYAALLEYDRYLYECYAEIKYLKTEFLRKHSSEIWLCEFMSDIWDKEMLCLEKKLRSHKIQRDYLESGKRPKYDIEQMKIAAESYPVENIFPPKGKHTKGYVAVCPFHDDHKPSLYVYLDGFPRYYCFVCNESGDMITAVMKLENKGYVDALRFLSGL